MDKVGTLRLRGTPGWAHVMFPFWYVLLDGKTLGPIRLEHNWFDTVTPGDCCVEPEEWTE